MMFLLRRHVVLLIACCLISGCSSEPTPQTIQGTVTLDGNSIAEGKITFVPNDSSAARVDGVVKEGKYSVDVFRGGYKVEIFSPRPAKNQPKQLPGPGEDAVTLEESIPAKYNHETQLTVEVTADKSAYDFALTTR